MRGEVTPPCEYPPDILYIVLSRQPREGRCQKPTLFQERDTIQFRKFILNHCTKPYKNISQNYNFIKILQNIQVIRELKYTHSSIVSLYLYKKLL